MATNRRSLDLLPSVFQTYTNKRFLNATLDQLIQEPRLRRFSSYVGRAEGSKVYQPGDPYINENDSFAQHYQLEPSLAVRDRTKIEDDQFKITNVYNYLDMLNKVAREGGINNDNDKLFNQEYYNYQGFVNVDKLVDYGQYYWVPNGPDSVDVNTGGVPVEKDFFVTINGTDTVSDKLIDQVTGATGHVFDGYTADINPTITLVRGGSYTFHVNQVQVPFYIQTEAGDLNDKSGSISWQQNLSKREVLGVDNNGTDAGLINFHVPKKTDQDEYINMTEFTTVDYVLDLPFNQMQNNFISYINTKFGGLDGIKNKDTVKTCIFTDTSDDNWQANGNFDGSFDDAGFDLGLTPNKAQRKGIWQLKVVDGIIRLGYISDWPVNTKVKVREGARYGNRYVFKDGVLNIRLVPVITAPLNKLYYQSSNYGYGEIILIDPYSEQVLNVNNIIGKKTYTSPNGVKFTNGLKIKFTGIVEPSSYRLKEYIVEGVGKSIELVSYQNLITPEQYTISVGSGYDGSGESFDTTNFDNTGNSPQFKDYIVVDRASRDGNPWSRGNRWFHKDVLNYAASVLTPGIGYVFNEENRAKRPIIEFVPNLALFNTGKKFLMPVNTIDITVKDALSSIEGAGYYYVDGTRLVNSTTVIFANDSDPTIRKTIFTSNVITVDGFGESYQLHLIPLTTASDGDCIVINQGTYRQGNSYRWDENSQQWVLNQQKIGINTEPLFDVFLKNHSISNSNVYDSTNFRGTKLFSYRKNPAATADPELGFGISYRSIGNIGDIVFDNNFDTESFAYKSNNLLVSQGINLGNPAIINSDLTLSRYNAWTKIADKSKQYILKDFTVLYRQTNDFALPLIYKTSNTEKNLFVTVNGTVTTAYRLLFDSDNNQMILKFNADLNEGDKVRIQIYGRTTEVKPVYTVPKNLERNSFNDIFNTVTLGQMRDHLTEMCNNNLYFTGEPSGNNNLRDIEYLNCSGTILQHSAPFHHAQLLFNNPSTDIIKSIDYNRREYSRFKDKFLDLLENTQFDDVTDSRAVVDTVLWNFTKGANSSSPFYYTGMAVSGNNFIKTAFTVFNPADRKYNAVNTYDYLDPALQYQDLLIYVNSVQIIHRRDYEINQRIITILPSFSLKQDDVIEIYEYSNSKGCMIPATPSKLGMYPSYIPQLIKENSITDTRVESQMVIQGHDGSRIPAFNDFRDDAILEFEKRVYNNIHLDWFADNTLPNHYTVEPTAFRETDYNLDQWTQLLSNGFLEWVGRNGVDVFTNSITNSNPFTWNYSTATDRLFDKFVPGHWRGMYKYFYDTDRPHTHPWEIAGYPNKPAWWELRYGPAPYTSGNLVMWGDLEQGNYYYDPTGGTNYNIVGTDPLYAKPGLTNIIPVDSHGNLLPPQATVIKSYNQKDAANSWRFGDQGPVETAWRRSWDYPFVAMMAYALAKPAEFCVYSYNLLLYRRDFELDQVVNISNNSRKLGSVITDDTAQYPGTNIWIRDRIVGLGQDVATSFVNVLEDATLNLSYKMAGFTDKDYLQILAEQSSPSSKNTSVLIPNENYHVVLTKSAPTSRDTYTAVIVERDTGGYRVRGFDNNRPYFFVIPSVVNDDAYDITIGPYSVTVYNEGDANQLLVVPYGTVLSSREQVADFLISYGRYLTSKGFQFLDILEDGRTVKDWTLSVREFLFFSQQEWDNHTVISLTPAGGNIKFDNGIATVDDISDSFNGSRLLDSDGRSLHRRDYRVFRNGTSFEINLNDTSKGIHLLDLETVQVEHTLLFDNTTVFNDVIFQTNLGNRQQRLKLIGRKTADWDGSLYAPGFLINHKDVTMWSSFHDYYKGDLVEHKKKYYTASKFLPGAIKFDSNDWYEVQPNLIKKKLIPNAAFGAQQLENFYDVDRHDVNEGADIQARHATGFQERQYFTDISLDRVSQHRFYLGMITEKGTQAVIDKFFRAKLPYLDNTVVIDEEWAVKEGSYGNTENSDILELSLGKIKSINNTVIVELLDKNDKRSTQWNTFKPNDLEVIPSSYSKDIFLRTREENKIIPDTGPVTLDEVSATVYDVNRIEAISSIVHLFGEGSRIWIAADIDDDWHIYRCNNHKGVRINRVDAPNDIELQFSTSRPHNLKVRDKVMLKGINARITTNTGGVGNTNVDGFYKVTQVSGNTFRVARPTNQAAVISSTVTGYLYSLESVRIDSRKDLDSATPSNGWQNGDKAYIDNSPSGWQVLENLNPWTMVEYHSPPTVTSTSNFGRASAISNDQNFYYVSSAESQGRIYVYSKDDVGTWVEIQALDAPDAGATDIGTTLSVNDLGYIVSGAPGSNGTGAVYIANTNTSSNTIQFVQSIVDTTYANGSALGTSVAASKDGQWIYITVPNAGTVDAYQLKKVTTSYNEYTGTGSRTQFAMPYDARIDAADELQIKVFVNGSLKAPYRDYTVDMTNVYVVFNTAPVTGADIVIEYADFYDYVDTMTVPSSFTWGNSITTTTDGQQILIGANMDTEDSSTLNSGAVYLYERSIENFTGDGSTVSFDTVNDPIAPKVFVDDMQLDSTEFSYSSFNVTLTTAPAISSVVRIETNGFQLVQKIISPVPQAGQNFGTSVAFCSRDCSIYVGAPKYRSTAGDSGAVWRYANIGKIYGDVTGKVTNPTVTPGDSIRINNYQVVFTHSDLDHVVSDINAAAIPGVTASNVGGLLKIKTDSQVSYNKLLVSPDSGTALVDLGLTPFSSIQRIDPVYQEDGASFGQNVIISPDSESLVVTSTKASSFGNTTFDSDRMTLDSGAMAFRDKLIRSGAVYIYEYQTSSTEDSSNIGKFAYATRLVNSNVASGDLLGTSAAISKNYLMVTSPKGNISGISTGLFYVHRNDNGDKVWKVLRTQGLDYDSRKLVRAVIYNKNTEQVIAQLPVLDGSYGKHIPSAISEVDYTSNYDPAVYNNVPRETGFNYDPKNAWGKPQVGKLWWDTNALKYLRWNQNNLISRANSRDLLFPASKINIYEWIESDVPPSQYHVQNLGTGVRPLYIANDVFTMRGTNDTKVGSKVKYYFWATKSSATASTAFGDRISEITQALNNPRTTNKPYVSLLSSNALALYNCKDFIGDDYMLRIEYNRMDDVLPVHNQWSIFRDSSVLGLSDSVYQKLTDSISGQDAQGRPVPDPKLKPKQRYGLGIRPRQSALTDPISARYFFSIFANDFFSSYPIRLIRSIAKFSERDPVPDPINYDDVLDNDIQLDYINLPDYVNKRLLITQDSIVNGGWTIRKYSSKTKTWDITRTQTYDVSKYWSYADWYASDYSADTIPDYYVDFNSDIGALSLKVNDIVKILNSTSGGFQLVRVTDTGLELVGQENSTIQLLPSFYDSAIAGQGLDSSSLESIGFSQDNSIEVRKIYDAVVQMLNNSTGVFVDQFRALGKGLFQQGLDLIANQNRFGDFLFKTSFISVKHTIRPLTQIPYYIKQPENVVQSYINEMKPYRAKLRKYTSIYPGSDSAELFSSDFDLPPYFSNYDQRFRSPQLENPLDADQFLAYPSKSWLDNRGFEIEYVDVVDGGIGYTNETILTFNSVVSPDGYSYGSGADAYVRTDGNGSIIQVVLLKRGAGYLDSPDITIQGTGTGARLKARIRNLTTRSIKSTLTFDRYTYTQSIEDWQPNYQYYRDDVVVYDNTAYRVSADFKSSSIIDFTYLVEYKIYRWEPRTRYAKEDIVLISFTDNLAYVVQQNHTTPDQLSDYYIGKNLREYTGQLIDNASDRIWANYAGGPGLPGKDLAQLMKGIEYPGVKVTGQTFAYTPGFDINPFGRGIFDPQTFSAEEIDPSIDTNYFSYFTDPMLGLRPEDIDTNGGKFIDEFSSHAPEELVPGRVYDTLDIKVTTMPGQDVLNKGFGPDIKLVGTLAGQLISFPFGTDVIGSVEKLIVWTKDSGYKVQDQDFTINWINKTINFSTTFTDPTDVVYVLTIGSTGEYILEKHADIISDGVTTVYPLPNQRISLAKQVYVKIDGQETSAYALKWNINEIAPWQTTTQYYQNDLFSYQGKVYRVSKDFASTLTFDLTVVVLYDYYAAVVFDTPPAAGAFVQIRSFNESDLHKAYSSVKEITYTVAGHDDGTGNMVVTYPQDYVFNLPEPMQYMDPWDAMLSVRLNGLELAPSNNLYLTGNGTTKNYVVALSYGMTASLLSDNDIVVVVDKVRKYNNIDYTLDRGDGTGDITVKFISAPANGSKIILADLSLADYRVMDTNTVRIKPTLNITGTDTDLKISDKIDIIQYSNHDMYDMRTQTFKARLTTTPQPGGIDAGGWDSYGFDPDIINVISNPVYVLSRACYNTAFLQVYIKGQLANPVYDYQLEDNVRIIVSPRFSLGVTDVVHIRHFSETVRDPTIRFRVFKDMNDNQVELGIGSRATTQLAQELNIDDTEIFVLDSTGLSSPGFSSNQPGVVFINSERITYWGKDDSTNRLYNIRRSTAGTGGTYHPAGTQVEDGSLGMKIPNGNSYWYNLVSGGSGGHALTTGTRLQDATTVQALYLRSISR